MFNGFLALEIQPLLVCKVQCNVSPKFWCTLNRVQLYSKKGQNEFVQFRTLLLCTANIRIHTELFSSKENQEAFLFLKCPFVLVGLTINKLKTQMLNSDLNLLVIKVALLFHILC